MDYSGRYPNGLGPVIVLFTPVIPRHPLKIWLGLPQPVSCRLLGTIIMPRKWHGWGMGQSPSVRSTSSTRKQMTCKDSCLLLLLLKADLWHWVWPRILIHDRVWEVHPLAMANPLVKSCLFLLNYFFPSSMSLFPWCGFFDGVLQQDSFIYGLFSAYKSLEKITICWERRGNEVSVTKKEVRNCQRDGVTWCVTGHTEY